MHVMLSFGVAGRRCAGSHSRHSVTLAEPLRRGEALHAKRLALALVAALLAGLFPTGARASLIVNGEFETGNLSGWVVNPGPNNDGIVVAPTGSFGAGIPANNGNWEVFFNAGNTPAGGSISQTFGTVSGA